MKKVFTLIVAGMPFLSAQAQQYSGGVRTGSSLWMDHHSGKCFTSDRNSSWDKEVFMRYNTKGKLVFEVTMGHYSLNKNFKPEENGVNVPEYKVLNVNERSQNIEWNISAQYDISCPALQQRCPAMSKLKSYIGVVLTPTLSRNTVKTSYINSVSDGTIHQSKSSKDELAIWTGLSHTLTYSIFDHLYLTSVVRLQLDPNRFFDNEGALKTRDSRLGLQLGLGYNF